MKDTITWLINVEQVAHDLYSKAAEDFSHDQDLHTFLNHAAEEEAWHYHIMKSAREHLRQYPVSKSQIKIDDDMRNKVNEQLHHIEALISEKTLSRQKLIDCIIHIEFSEWNQLFLYVVNSFKEKDRLFGYAAARIQHHLAEIEIFLENDEYGREKIKTLKALPTLWEKKILIVDDDEAIATLLCSLLGTEWETIAAHNGQEALDLVQQNHFDLIISDFNMPVMDGKEFYQKASLVVENLHETFLFHTGFLSEDLEEFCQEHKIEIISKPSFVIQINDIVSSKLAD